MLVVFLRGVILYIVVVFSARLMGKRQLGELSPAELVITILISNVATLTMEDISIPLIMGVVPIVTLVCLDVIVSYLTLRSRKARRIISGQPRVIISDGKIDQKALLELRYTVDDIFSSLRGLGIFNIESVQYAVVETTGSISVLQKPEFLPITPDYQKTHEKPSDPPKVLISDGELIVKENKKLMLELERRSLKPSDIFLCTIDSNGKLYITRKEGDKK